MLPFVRAARAWLCAAIEIIVSLHTDVQSSVLHVVPKKVEIFGPNSHRNPRSAARTRRRSRSYALITRPGRLARGPDHAANLLQDLALMRRNPLMAARANVRIDDLQPHPIPWHCRPGTGHRKSSRQAHTSGQMTPCTALMMRQWSAARSSWHNSHLKQPAVRLPSIESRMRPKRLPLLKGPARP